MPGDATLWASTEVLLLVFDIAAFADLLAASRVCCRWRAIALGHVRFWRDITIAACSPTALDLFLARLSWAEKSQLQVCVVLTHVAPKDARKALNRTILPAIARHLPRISALSLSFSALCNLSLRRHLSRRAAPCLRILRLHIVPLSPLEGPEGDPLPKDWLNTACPLLAEFHMTYADPKVLSHVSKPQVSVKTLALACGQAGNELPLSLMRHFPGLYHLAVRGEGYLLPHFISKEDATILSHLQRLDLDCDGSIYALFEDQEWIHGLPHIRLCGDACMYSSSLVATLPGEFDVTFECDDAIVEAVFRCTVTGKTRIFRTSLSTFRTLTAPAVDFNWSYDKSFCDDDDEDPQKAVLLSMIDVSVRITALSIPAHAWHTFSRGLSSLSTCERLTLSLYGHRPLSTFIAPAGAINCPMLRTIVLKACVGPLRFQASDVAKLLRYVISPESGTPRLQLDRTVLHGDCVGLQKLVDISDIVVY
ncbi:hypothetical protein AURDEDRAFT_156760 [Auricularia subglabra TFB-10046 SS5]|nr:hypothetical protein AURDEDRAFT_156760 [Auricularia subglabra TFB-10046 SS5]